MSVIIRLQNLPWSANALDIRGFFRGLSIPDGGVHIVGGEMGDAFIAFSTDEDARQAMSMDRGKLNEVQIRLLLSSRAEMQKVIETARNISMSMQMQRSQQSIILPAPQPPVITSTTLKHIMSNQQQNHKLQNSSHQYQGYNPQLNFDNSQDSRDSRGGGADGGGGSSRKDDKYRNRTRSKDRRSSRSTSRNRGGDRSRRSSSRGRDRDSRRRGRDRSRSRTRSRDRKNRKMSRRSRSRDRNNSGRTRWDKDVRDRESDRNYKDKDVKKSIESEVAKMLNNEGIVQPLIPPSNNSTNINVWKTSVPTPLLSATAGNINQGYSTVGETVANQLPVYQTNISAGYLSSSNNPAYPLTSNQQGSGITGTQPNKSDESKINFQNMFNMLPQTGVNYMNTGKSSNTDNGDNKNYSLGNQSSFNLGNSSGGGNNSPQNHNVSANTSSGNNNMTSFSGIFSSLNKKIEDNNIGGSDSRLNQQQFQQPSTKTTSTAAVSSPSTNPNDPNKNYSNINFDELRGNCIKICNMCPSTSYSDIRRFFSGLFIANNGIKMINDKHGLRIGVAFIRFVRPESKPKAFIRNGSPLKSKKVTIESVTEEEFDEEVDSYKPLRRFENTRFDDRPPPHIPLRPSGENSSPTPSLPGTDQKSVVTESAGDTADDNKQPTKESTIEVIDDEEDDNGNRNKEVFTILKLEDVPIFAKEYDIMKIFSSFTILDILLQNNEDSKRHLDCYVKFHRPEDAKLAYLNRGSHVIGHKQIFVSPCTEDKYMKIKEVQNQPQIIEDSEENHDNQENSNDLSYDPFNPVIENKFRDMSQQSRPNVFKENSQHDDRTGGGGSNDNQMNFQMSNNRMNVNSNNSNNNGNNNNNNNNNSNNNMMMNEPQMPPSLLTMASMDPRRRDNKLSRFSSPSSDNKPKTWMKRFVMLRNCEYKLMRRDFAEFFATINLTPERIEIIRNSRNQPCGECVVEFKDDIDAEKAFIKNNTLLAGRTCRMDSISVNSAADKIGDNSIRDLGDDNSNTNKAFNNMFGNSNMYFGNSNDHDDNNTFRSGNLFRQSNNNSSNNNNFLNNRGDDGSRGSHNNDDNFEQRRSGRQSRFSDNDDGGNCGGNSNSGRMNNNNFNNTNNNFNNNSNNRLGGNDNSLPPINNSLVDQFGQPGCVISLKNVPYQATTEDILEFFGNFNLGPQNVIRRYNDDGTPTGDARVAFTAPIEARTAYERMRNCKIFNRSVYLSLL